MISIIAQYAETSPQERLLRAALGIALAGVVVFYQRKCIYKSISDNQSQFFDQYQREPIFGRKSRLEFAHLWNKTVDQTWDL